MIRWHVCCAWIGILLGFVTGSAQGLFFHREDWRGGYASWTRRVSRLGHVSLFGLAFVNMGFAYTAERFAPPAAMPWSSVLLIVGTFTMPFVCYLSAWKPAFRHLFIVPVLSLVFAVGLLLIDLLA